MIQPTQYQMFAQVKGYIPHFRICAGDRVQAVGLDTAAGTLFVLVERVQIKETHRYERVSAVGLRFLQASLAPTGQWRVVQDSTNWVDAKGIEDYRHQPRTADERWQQILWERACHRAGNPKNPRDSYARQQQGYSRV